MLEKLKLSFAISSMTIKQNIELSGGEIGKILLSEWPFRN